jgi:hypothetical protein
VCPAMAEVGAYSGPPVDRRAISAELADARVRLQALLGSADTSDLRRPSNGTRWTNEQLLFHMVFGYLVVRVLLRLVRAVSRLPAPVGRGFAVLLDSTSEPEAALRRGMAFPTSWDPYVKPYMTLADVYRFPNLHFQHHSRQLTLRGGGSEESQAV